MQVNLRRDVPRLTARTRAALSFGRIEHRRCFGPDRPTLDDNGVAMRIYLEHPARTLEVALMATEEVGGGGASEDLAARISQCIAEADAHDLHVVAAHLDAALNAFRALGLAGADVQRPSCGPLH